MPGSGLSSNNFIQDDNIINMDKDDQYTRTFDTPITTVPESEEIRQIWTEEDYKAFGDALANALVSISAPNSPVNNRRRYKEATRPHQRSLFTTNGFRTDDVTNAARRYMQEDNKQQRSNDNIIGQSTTGGALFDIPLDLQWPSSKDDNIRLIAASAPVSPTHGGGTAARYHYRSSSSRGGTRKQQQHLRQHLATVIDDGGILCEGTKVDVSKQLLKTRVCKLFLEGKCKYGKKCFFAHDVGELRQVPDLRKTTLCKLYAQGKCTRGDDCNYAHGSKELRATEGVYKTVICNWWKQGHCQYGTRCRFAHGEQELVPVSTQSNSQPTSLTSSPRKAASTTNIHNNNGNGLLTNQHDDNNDISSSSYCKMIDGNDSSKQHHHHNHHPTVLSQPSLSIPLVTSTSSKYNECGGDDGGSISSHHHHHTHSPTSSSSPDRCSSHGGLVDLGDMFLTTINDNTKNDMDDDDVITRGLLNNCSTISPKKGSEVKSNISSPKKNGDMSLSSRILRHSSDTTQDSMASECGNGIGISSSNNNDEYLCDICHNSTQMAADINNRKVFYPCGHGTVCLSCAENIINNRLTCPKCSSTVIHTLSVYIPTPTTTTHNNI